MSNSNLTVVATRHLPTQIENRMKELFEVHLRREQQPMRRDELVQAIANCEVLVSTITDTIDHPLLALAGKRLKLIANYGAGFDHIDVEAARERNILVSNTPDVATEDTADIAISLILAVARRLREGLSVMQSERWDGWAPTAMMGSRVGGKNLGILGMGRIGTAVARRAAAFGMKIHYHNRRRVHADTEAELKATYWESLDQMVHRMDIISVNCPHTPSTYHLLSERRLSLMRPETIIVNTSRGDVIDQNALIRMLRKKKIAGAGLDVFARGKKATLPPQSLSNVVLLPHMGSATIEGRIEMGEKVLINIMAIADGHRPPDLVVPGMM